MNSFDLYLQHLLAHFGPTTEALFQLLLSALAGGMVGAEREMRGREAGFRTHILICMAATLVMVLSRELVRTGGQNADPHVHVTTDLIRIGYAVMTGIGFLGAGAILQHQGSVRGLTTAAAMWSVAAIGLTSGYGLYSLTIMSATLVVLTLWLFNYVGDFFPRRRYRTVKLRSTWTATRIPNTVDWFKGSKVDVIETSFERSGPELATVDIQLRVVFTKRSYYYAVEQRLNALPDYQLVGAASL